MVLRWAATAYLETEQKFRKLMGYRDLWMLQAVLDDQRDCQEQDLAAQRPQTTRAPRDETRDS